MEIIEVKDTHTRKEFIQLPVRLYKSENTAWIRPLDDDINSVFDTSKNKYFRHGECTRWILKDSTGTTVGRVAAFIDKRSVNKDNDQPTGGMGFFECINNQEAAFKLFDTCKAWLEERGMEAVDGPINFGERDQWWGCLIDGFEHEPNYCCNYNFDYYPALFEAYGFQVYFKQFTFAREIMGALAPKVAEKAAKLQQDPRYDARHLKKAEISKYIEDFREVYNNAWANHSGVAKMSSLQAKALMNKMKPIMDEKVLWFAYFDNKPIGFFILLPEVNQIFKHVNGKLDLLGKLTFLWYKWRKTNKKLLGVIFGVDPAHQGKGVDGLMIEKFRQMVQGDYRAYDFLEMNWIGDFNPKMINVVKAQVGGRINKTHVTYRKLFDESKPFKRMPIKSSGLR
ncbi:hypothetical protein [Chondrinema litorale]|uniref:hypothetical protein n=1 Tax=Chondrinema litorale TaxID=2994555 RepID=UPI00254380A1|nr:hypothetical protein [Chondrinema litorale]UZR95058.1 hypothetical protein OQ292_04415 [Chondrinema litorale]